MEEHIRQRVVKREETSGGNDPENGSPDGSGGGKCTAGHRRSVMIRSSITGKDVLAPPPQIKNSNCAHDYDNDIIYSLTEV